MGGKGLPFGWERKTDAKITLLLEIKLHSLTHFFPFILSLDWSDVSVLPEVGALAAPVISTLGVKKHIYSLTSIENQQKPNKK